MTELKHGQLKLVERLAQVRAEIKQLEDTEAQIVAGLRQFPLGDYTHAGEKRLLVGPPPRRFSPDRALEMLSPQLLDLCTVRRVEPATAKKVLPPALYEQCQVATSDQPTIRLA